MAVTTITVDVWSDVQCPWCYLGKRRFEQAVQELGPDTEVEVKFHSFELTPDVPVEVSESAKEFIAKRNGWPIEKMERAAAEVTALAATVGLEYNYDTMRPTNSSLAHELIAFAKSKGRQLEMAEHLFDSYFRLGAHVGRIDDLVALGAQLDLDEDEMREALSSRRFRNDVEDDYRTAEQLGIRSVPFFVVDGKYGLSGAQSAGTFGRVFDRALNDREQVA